MHRTGARLPSTWMAESVNNAERGKFVIFKGVYLKVQTLKFDFQVAQSLKSRHLKEQMDRRRRCSYPAVPLQVWQQMVRDLETLAWQDGQSHQKPLQFNTPTQDGITNETGEN